MPENILILADWRLASIVDDTVPPRDPIRDDDEEEEDEGRTRTRRGRISRQSSGNPNPTNSPRPLYEAYAGSAKKTRPTTDIFGTFWRLSMKLKMDYSDGKGRIE